MQNTRLWYGSVSDGVYWRSSMVLGRKWYTYSSFNHFECKAEGTKMLSWPVKQPRCFWADAYEVFMAASVYQGCTTVYRMIYRYRDLKPGNILVKCWRTTDNLHRLMYVYVISDSLSTWMGSPQSTLRDLTERPLTERQSCYTRGHLQQSRASERAGA